MSGYAVVSTSNISHWLEVDPSPGVLLWVPRFTNIDVQTGGGFGGTAGPMLIGSADNFELARPHGDGTSAGIRVPPGLWYAHLVYDFAVTSYSGADPADMGPAWMNPNISTAEGAGWAGAAHAYTSGSGEFPLVIPGRSQQWSGVFLAEGGADEIIIGFNGQPEFWTADWRQWTASDWLVTNGTAQLAVMQIPGSAAGGNVALDALTSQGVVRV